MFMFNNISNLINNNDNIVEPDLHTMHRGKIFAVLFVDKRWLDYQSQEPTSMSLVV